VLLTIKIFCNVMVCSWVSGFGRFEEKRCLRNVENHYPKDAASHFSRLESSISNAI